MRSWILGASLLLTACGASGASPGSAPAAESGGECTPGTMKKMPPGWVDTGATIVITLKDRKPVSVEGRAKDGAVHPLSVGENAREIVAQEACRLGGFATVVDAAVEEGKDGPVTLHVARPAVVDEKADLAAFCAGPPDPRITSSLDAAQIRLLASASYEERLTSPRWRRWLAALWKQAEAGDDAAKAKLFADKAAEIRAAGGPANCWFAAALVAR